MSQSVGPVNACLSTSAGGVAVLGLGHPILQKSVKRKLTLGVGLGSAGTPNRTVGGLCGPYLGDRGQDAKQRLTGVCVRVDDFSEPVLRSCTASNRLPAENAKNVFPCRHWLQGCVFLPILGHRLCCHSDSKQITGDRKKFSSQGINIVISAIILLVGKQTG